MNTADTHLPNWLARCAENIPDHLALKYAGVSWSFAELDRQATHLARLLAGAGVQTNSRVALITASGLPYVTCVHALMRLGTILVPLNIRLTQEELNWQVEDIQANFIVSDTRYLTQATAIAQALPNLPQLTLDFTATENEALSLVRHHVSGPEPISADPAVTLRTLIDLDATQAIMYTSGTTGKPKGVIITYGMQWWSAIGSALNLGHNPGDCWLNCMPLFHVGGLTILIRSVINGTSVILLEKFDAPAVNHAIQTEHVSLISVVAIMLQRMLTTLDADTVNNRYPSTLRCVLLGGGPAPRPLLEDCAQRHIPVVQTYGLTESCSQAVTLAPADALRKIGSAGRPLLPVQLRIMPEHSPLDPASPAILHENSQIALNTPGTLGRNTQLTASDNITQNLSTPPNTPGIICVKGPNITPGYDHRPAATAATIHEGWLSTGDIGYLDAEGYLYVLDRRNDLIISGGENIYPAEIEATLLTHPAITEAGVCGQTDPQWGQVPIAFVVLHPNSTATPETLQAFAIQHLARYKLPRTIHIVTQLPRNASGKLLRRELPHLSVERSFRQ